MRQERRQSLEWQLCIAAGKGDKNAVAQLLQQGVAGSSTRQARTALMEAAAKGHVEIVALLLDHGADVHVMGED